MKCKSYIAVIGATASGKSSLAMRLAEQVRGELINCDSVQFYRGFNIGSAKPDAEERARVSHHLWDILDWNQDFDARMYAELARQTVEVINLRGSWPLVVGGSGLYLRALWQDRWHDLPKDEDLRQELAKLSVDQLREQLLTLDPNRAAVIHPNDRFRLQRAVEIASLLGHPVSELPPVEGRRAEAYVIRLHCPRDVLHERIRERTANMLKDGFIDEVEALLGAGVSKESKPMQSIGYAQVCAYLQGRISKDQLFESIVIATRQYAKRQETWFRGVKADLVWNDVDRLEDLVSSIEKLSST